MVKFSKGMWCLAPDTVADWATEAVKAEAKEDSIRCVAVWIYLGHCFDRMLILSGSYSQPDV